jgi:hypothetical protein
LQFTGEDHLFSPLSKSGFSFMVYDATLPWMWVVVVGLCSLLVVFWFVPWVANWLSWLVLGMAFV